MNHNRKCKNEPNEILFKINNHLQQAAILFEELHNNFDGITVDVVQTGYAETSVIMERKRDG